MVIRGNRAIRIVVLLLVLSVSFNNTVLAADSKRQADAAEAAAQKAGQYLYRYYSENEFDDIRDWSIIAWFGGSNDYKKRMGNSKENKQFKQGLKETPDSTVTTDVARFILAYRIGGMQETAYSKWVAQLQQSQKKSGKFTDDVELGGQELVNAHVWAIIALCCAKASDWDRGAAYKWLSSKQNSDGGFGYTIKSASDVDVTASVIIALSLMGNNSSDPVMKKCHNYITAQKITGGGWGSWGQENLESSALVLQAQVCLSGDQPNRDQSKKMSDTVDSIMKYQLADGSFKHILKGSSNIIATEHAILALGDYSRGKCIYQVMTDM